MNLGLFLATTVLACSFAFVVLVYAFQSLYGFIKLPSRAKRVSGETKADAAKVADEVRITIPAVAAGAHIKSFQWRDICVFTAGTSTTKQLLFNSYGSSSIGDFCAIVGPSGAGKSTLLDVIAGRMVNLKATGGVLLNNMPVTSQTLSANASFVAQTEAFLPSLTVWETLNITASLRLPESLSRNQKNALMQTTIESMGLIKVRQTQVGGLLPGGLRVRGISGGEQRRLSIACGLIGAPKLIFLDEPTSGLDANAALVVTQCISRLCTSGDHLVIASIHQPRAAIWDLFNRVVLLSEGYTLYCGPTADVVEWFCTGPTKSQYIPELHGTPCEWLADLISVTFEKIRSHEAEKEGTQSVGFSLEDVRSVAARYKKSVESTGDLTAEDEDADRAVMPKAIRNMTSYWNQYLVLQGRAVAAYTRNPANVAGRTIMAIFVAVFAGMIFMRPPAGMAGVQQNSSAIFITLLVITLMPFCYMSLFVADKQFFKDDPAQSLYTSIMYYLSIVSTNAIVSTMNGVIIMLIIYSMLNLYSVAKTVMLNVVLAGLHSLVSVQVLVFSAIITPNQDLAFVLAVSYTCICTFLGGYFVHIDSLWGWLQGISYLTYFRYTTSGMLRLQYTDRNDGCGLDLPSVPAMPPSQAGFAYPNNSTAMPPVPAHVDPCQQVMTSFGSVLEYGPVFGGLVAILVLLHIASALGLARLSRRF